MLYQVSALNLPISELASRVYAWIADYVASCGDEQPNQNEIHLDPDSYTRIHGLYAHDCELLHQESASYPYFMSIWDKCFDYVKMRQFKNVSGNK